MEPKQITSAVEISDKFTNLKKVTPLSKYLAMILFVLLPFVGVWIGYTYSSYKVTESEVIDLNTESERNSAYEDFGLEPSESDTLYSNEDNFDTVTIRNDTGTVIDLGYFSKVFSVYGNLYFLHGVLDMGQELTLTKIADLSEGSSNHQLVFDYIGGNYMKNEKGVVYMGGGLTYPRLVNNADSQNFSVFVYKPMSNVDYEVVFGIDSTALYHHGVRLDDIDLQNVAFKVSARGFGWPIVHDADTYWYPQGNCHYSEYRRGTEDELNTYSFPCGGGGIANAN